MIPEVHELGGETADVTVVTPTIPGREQMLARALASVGRQTRRPASIVVVEDHAGEGAARARNVGLAAVSTTWMAWLDDDDELLPDHLSTLLMAAAATGADLVYSYPVIVGGRDPLAAPWHGRLVASPIDVPFGPEQERWLRDVGNFIPVTYLVRTDLVRRVGGMPEPYSVEWPRDCEDYGLLLRLLDAGARFHHVCGIRTWRYYIHGANTGGSAAQTGTSGGSAPIWHRSAADQAVERDRLAREHGLST
jgi:glycosyltransferase involved in cell wall biosynthesis